MFPHFLSPSALRGTLARRCALVLCPLLLSACGGPRLTLEASSVEFGEVGLGSTETTGVDVQVTTGGPAEVSVHVDPADGPFFIAELPPPVFETGVTQSIRVSFHPSTTGDDLAVLVVEATNVEGVSHSEVVLRGSGRFAVLDLDRDGFASDEDCDDDNPSVYPGAEEVCDGQDSDCDGELPASEEDADEDGWSECAGDCADEDPTVHPDAKETCDGIDNNCDGDLGEADSDEDSYRLCEGDCDDEDPAIHPGADEGCDGIDTDCDGIVQGDEIDGDSDGYAPCSGDCDDADSGVNPDVLEACNGRDDDCDPSTWASGGEDDVDLDGSPVCADCDDADPLVYPGAPELCNGLDDDCDPSTVASGGEDDVDLDGSPVCADCDDGAPTVYPGALELCDGLDNDCDASTEAAGGEGDGDSDGSPACADCDDGNTAVYPGAVEACDGLDTDCDPLTVLPDGEDNVDGDPSFSCEDCDDTDPDTYPGATELCDFLDNDCDGSLAGDETDDDGDGFVECTGEDCDDTEASVNINGVEECYDTLDGDCDGTVNEDCDCPIWAWDQVPPPCVGPGSYECPHETITDALDAAASSPACGEVWLRPGTYEENLIVEGLAILHGAGEPGDVTIDGQQAGPVLLVEESATLTLSSVTITDGLASEGGGISALSGSWVVIDDVIFDSNACSPGGSGGAGAFVESVLQITNSQFIDNDCGFGEGDEGNDGGALYSIGSAGLIDGNTFSGNTAGDGSDLYMVDNWVLAEVSHNSFLDGTTGDSTSPVGGEVEGGAVVLNTDNVLLRNNFFGGHVASEGGGAISIVTTGGSVQITNNVMIYNDSGSSGALHFDAQSVSASPATIANNIIVDNVGYGMFSETGFVPLGVSHNDVFGNSLGGYGNAVTSFPGPPGDFSFDPGFVAVSDDDNWGNDDFSLDAGSLCIDAGLAASNWNDPDGSPNDLGIFGGPFGGWDGP